ncbi:MAG TPA: hypothetical protein VGG29_19800 [Caulobacteraceae bacterium]|jgi:hypothetical protein
MKRFVIGLAAVAMSAAAWTQAPAQETGGGASAPYLCTLGIGDPQSPRTQVVTAQLRTADACRSWAVETTHLDPSAGGYELLVHEVSGKMVVHQVCNVKGLAIFGSSRAAFSCKDVAA